VNMGMSTRIAEAACRRCLTTFGSLQVPSVLRSDDRADIFRYLAALGSLNRRSLVAVLTSAPTLARFAAGLLGYYRKREF